MSSSKLLLKKLRNLRKSYFTLADLRKVYKGKQSNLQVLLSRLVKQGRLTRLKRGIYTLDSSRIDWEALACEMLQPSYISLEYALWQYGLINEVPARITLVTPKKSRLYRLPGNVFEYSHISKSLFNNYKVDKNILIAEKEKAFLDEIYLVSLKKRYLSLSSIDISALNKSRIKQWAKDYPGFTIKLAKKLLEK